MNGILLVDKPVGISSFGVVAKVRGIWRAQLREQGISVKKAKVGHTGTLDPMASGLMILVLGEYCKRAAEFSKLDKTYEVEMTLGQTSTTGDQEGEKTHVSDAEPTLEEIQLVLESFVGEQQQIPPIYSAIKVNGQRAYDLARKGKEVVMEPRTVTIYALEGVSYNYPIVKFTVDVSSGTYIRSLTEDIGKKLATGAYMSNLRRTKISNFAIEQALSMEKLSLQTILDHLQSV